MDPQRIDITAQQGTWERWSVRADRPQSFHIEGVMFRVRNVNGSTPFPEDRGWKDTVWIDGQVELLVYYTQPSWSHFPFQFLSQTWSSPTAARLARSWLTRRRNACNPNRTTVRV